VLGYGCSASTDGSFGQVGSGGGGGIGEAGVDELHLGTTGAEQELDGASLLNPLCGVGAQGVKPCTPDDALACDDYVPPSVSSGGGGGGGGMSPNPPGAVGPAGAGGEGGASSSPNTGDGGFGAGINGSLAGDGGAAGQSMTGAAGSGVTPASFFGCQVQRTGDTREPVVSKCGVVGLGGSNAPCLTSSDCQAGFGCVGDQTAGLCQRYCCSDATTCDTDTYCAERPLRDAVTNAPSGVAANPLLIPVCVPAENCDLSTPYPCTAGTQCACKAGTACLVVRNDGTTTCAVPGKGKAGDPCPCAWDHVCSVTAKQCLKLCPTSGASGCDSTGKCQSVGGLPDGWGVCIGASG
jgi:hypothetical protein